MWVALWVDAVPVLTAALAVAVLGAGASLFHIVRRVRRDVKMHQLRAAHPAQPWRWDHAWDERGTRDDDTMRRARQQIVGGILLALLAVPASAFSVAALVAGPTSLGAFAVPFIALALVLDAVMVHLFVEGARLAARRLRYGCGVAAFEGFPFQRGERLCLHVVAPRALPRDAHVTATLRCVQERLVTVGADDDSTRLQPFEVYRDTAPAELLDAGPSRRALRVTFAVPSDAPATDLASYPCRYWEVDVEATTDGIDYGGRFLVPVY
jgi:hypothetical protein